MNAASSFRVEMDGVTIGTFTVPNTGGYEIWQSVTATNIALTAEPKRCVFIASQEDSISTLWSSPTTVNPGSYANAGLIKPSHCRHQLLARQEVVLMLMARLHRMHGQKSPAHSGNHYICNSSIYNNYRTDRGTYKFELKVTDTRRYRQRYCR